MTETRNGYEFHELADIFPMMGRDDFDALVNDISVNGLLEPIILYEGKILDGRNRYDACIQSGKDIRFENYNGSNPVQYVISKNLSRRHLTSSQRAVISLKVEEQLAVEARKRQATSTGGTNPQLSQIFEKADNPIHAAEEAAKLLGTNRQYVHDAKKINKEAPDLLDKVQTGELTIPRAMYELNQRVRAELKKEPLPIPQGKYKTIVIDPPWPIEKIQRVVAPNQYAFEYPTMTIEEIKDFPIPQQIAHDDCHLFMWTTQKYLPYSFDILNNWGFRYVFTMVWHKPGGFQPYNLPQYNCEFILYGKRGSSQFIETKNFFTCFDAGRNGHSVKPDSFYKLIERVCPAPRIDVFSRTQRNGYDVWGNEV